MTITEDMAPGEIHFANIDGGNKATTDVEGKKSISALKGKGSWVGT